MNNKIAIINSHISGNSVNRVSKQFNQKRNCQCRKYPKLCYLSKTQFALEKNGEIGAKRMENKYIMQTAIISEVAADKIILDMSRH